MRIPHLKLKILLESNPLKSRILVLRLAVRPVSPLGFSCLLRTYRSFYVGGGSIAEITLTTLCSASLVRKPLKFPKFDTFKFSFVGEKTLVI